MIWKALLGLVLMLDVQTHFRQAQEYVKANRPDLALKEYRAILELEPANLDARGNLGVLLFFQGDYRQAAPELRKAVEARPSLWRLQALLGMAEKRSGDPKGARADLEQCLPHLDETRLRLETGLELIEVCFAGGDLEKAAEVVAGMRKYEPANPELLYIAQRVYSSLADESLLSMTMVAPKSARMHQLMAQQMARQGDQAGAIAHYREALKLEPKLPGLHFDLAEMLHATKQDEAAETEYRAALAVNPFDGKAECRLGEIAARRTDTKEALAHYSRAVELQPDDAEANLGLSRILSSLNQPEKAQTYLERAVKLDPTNATAHYRLAALYRAGKRPEDARRELEEYRKYKEMKERLKDIYREMKLAPAKEEGEIP